MKIRVFQSGMGLIEQIGINNLYPVIGTSNQGFITPIGQNNHRFWINQRNKIIKIKTQAKFGAFDDVNAFYVKLNVHSSN